MDGGGRLDQPLMRSGPGVEAAVEQIGMSFDAPHPPRAEDDLRRGRPDRLAWLASGRRLMGRSVSRIVRLPPPPGVGVAASMLLLAATLGYGAIAGGHVAAIVDWLKDARDSAANAAGFRIAAISLTGARKSAAKRFHDRRRDRARVAVFSRRRRGAHSAVGESLDRRCGGSQALSGPPADHHYRAAGFRALAEGRRSRHRRGRHRPRTVRREPYPRAAAGCRARAHRQAKDFLAIVAATRGSLAGGARLGAGSERRWNLRLNNGIDVRLPELMSSRRSTGWLRSPRQEAVVARHRRRRSAAARARHRRLSDAAARSATTLSRTRTTKADITALEGAFQHRPSSARAQRHIFPALLAADLGAAHDIAGPVQCVSTACVSGLLAIQQGALLIQEDKADLVFVVGVDLFSDFVLSGFTLLKSLEPEGCRPFDAERKGLSLGEGAGSGAGAARDGCVPRAHGDGMGEQQRCESSHRPIAGRLGPGTCDESGIAEGGSRSARD